MPRSVPVGAEGEWLPRGTTPEHLQSRQFEGVTEAPDDFQLPPEKQAYYDARDAAEEHKQKMAGMGVQERHEYMRGLREELNDRVPKPGDFDTPLKRDLPPIANRGPAPPRQPKPPSMRSQANRIGRLARRSRGSRRR